MSPAKKLQDDLGKLHDSMVTLQGKLKDLAGEKGLGGLHKKLTTRPGVGTVKPLPALDTIALTLALRKASLDRDTEEGPEAKTKAGNILDSFLSDKAYSKDVWVSYDLDLLKKIDAFLTPSPKNATQLEDLKNIIKTKEGAREAQKAAEELKSEPLENLQKNAKGNEEALIKELSAATYNFEQIGALLKISPAKAQTSKDHFHDLLKSLVEEKEKLAWEQEVQAFKASLPTVEFQRIQLIKNFKAKHPTISSMPQYKKDALTSLK